MGDRRDGLVEKSKVEEKTSPVVGNGLDLIFISQMFHFMILTFIYALTEIQTNNKKEYIKRT